jgi:N-acetyl-gamma-glutamyl-phosphate reductase
MHMKVGIINITSYAGVELARLLYRHPNVSLTTITGRSAVGQKLEDVFPHLSHIDMTIKPELDDSVDLVFSALPHKTSAETVAPFLADGIKVVDISADFRLKNTDEYQQWYETPHPCPQYLKEATYGLTELYRKKIATSQLVANPGCYPTSAILGLAPALKAGIIENDVIVDSKSGVSGAGRSLSLGTHFSEVNENVMAYGIKGHRHLPEIIQELTSLAGGAPTKVTFLPHLIPMTRGILSSCYATIKPNAIGPLETASQRVIELYSDFYKEDPFVKVVSVPPQTKQTWGSNFCLVHPSVDVRTGRLIVISCLDNLVKGASGQAVENMNIMCGLPETTGLDHLSIYP